MAGLTDASGVPIGDDAPQPGMAAPPRIVLKDNEALLIRLGMAGPAVAGGFEEGFSFFPDCSVGIGPGILSLPIIYWQMSSSQDIIWYARDFQAYGVPFSTMIVLKPAWWADRVKKGKQWVGA